MSDEMKLTPAERTSYDRLQEKYQIIKDRTLLVAMGWSHGFYAYGEGGIGKSYTVIRTLEENNLEYRLLNTRLSAAGFVQQLEQHNAELFVIEDIRDVLDSPTSLNLLLSAMWGQRNEEGRMIRRIVYTTASQRFRFDFEFEGSIIFTGNRPLGDIPELRALRTRIPVYQLQPSREEIFAVAKMLAIQGFKSDRGNLDPKTCLEIFNYYRLKLPTNRLPDLRTLDRAYMDFLGIQELTPLVKTGWRPFLDSAMKENSETEPPNKKRAKGSQQRVYPPTVQPGGAQESPALIEARKRIAARRAAAAERLAESENGQQPLDDDSDLVQD
jgi:hypothetical protein